MIEIVAPFCNNRVKILNQYYNSNEINHFITMSTNCCSSLWFGINFIKNGNRSVHYYVDDLGIKS